LLRSGKTDKKNQLVVFGMLGFLKLAEMRCSGSRNSEGFKGFVFGTQKNIKNKSK